MYTCKKSMHFSVGYSHEQFYDYRESKFFFVKDSLLCQMYYFIHIYSLCLPILNAFFNYDYCLENSFVEVQVLCPLQK